MRAVASACKIEEAAMGTGLTKGEEGGREEDEVEEEEEGTDGEDA